MSNIKQKASSTESLGRREGRKGGRDGGIPVSSYRNTPWQGGREGGRKLTLRIPTTTGPAGGPIMVVERGRGGMTGGREGGKGGREGGRGKENIPCGSRPPLALLAVQSWSSKEEGMG